jgi:hypothetical protein
MSVLTLGETQKNLFCACVCVYSDSAQAYRMCYTVLNSPLASGNGESCKASLPVEGAILHEQLEGLGPVTYSIPIKTSCGQSALPL